jgi:hypothetical protein
MHGRDLEAGRPQQPGHAGPDRRVGVLAGGLLDQRVKLGGVREGLVPGRRIAEPVAGRVVRLGEDEAPARTQYAA